MSAEFEKEASANGMTADISTDMKQVQLPLNLTVGEKLPDEEMTKMTIRIYGMMSMTVTITMSNKNRKVEAIEDLETPAGTFNCYKISYEMETLTDMEMRKDKSKTKIVEWLSPEVGTVKQEQYSERGKLESTMLLTEAKNL